MRIRSVCASCSRKKRQHWELAISDDGMGMKAARSCARKHGLRAREHAASARKAIGGEWCLVSKPGEGTRISVRVPKRPPPRAASETSMAAAPKIRVILADDHPVVRDGLAAIVNQQTDMQVVAEAGDGEEAIEALRAAHAGCDGARSAHAEARRRGGGAGTCWRSIRRRGCSS